MTEPVSTAQYFPWEGGAVFVGTAGVIPGHAHQAIQICFLFEGRIRLRASNDDLWTDYDLAIVPSRQAHAMDGSKIHYGATLFVEPETREGRILTAVAALRQRLGPQDERRIAVGRRARRGVCGLRASRAHEPPHVRCAAVLDGYLGAGRAPRPPRT